MKSLREPINCLILVLLTGCSVGPELERRQVDTGNWLNSPAHTERVLEWSEIFTDTQLNQLIQRVLANSKSLEISYENIEQVKASRGITNANRWPTIDANASYTRYQQSLASPGAASELINAGLADRSGEFYNAGLEASWELDLFGRNRKLRNAAVAQLHASEASHHAIRLSLFAETAIAYFEFQGAQQRLDLLDENIKLLSETSTLTEQKARSGLVRSIDALRARAELEATSASRPTIDATKKAASYRLAILMSVLPETLVNELKTVALPAAPEFLNPGTRADLLLNRPDIIRAQHNLAASAASLGVAKADFFPRLVLNAQFGFEAESSSDLGSALSRTTGVVPFFKWPVFQGKRLRSAYALAESRQRQSLLDYEQTVLEGIFDAETAISNYRANLDSLQQLSLAATAIEAATETARRLYEDGLTDSLTVLDAQRKKIEIDDQRVQLHTKTMISAVVLYKALGG